MIATILSQFAIEGHFISAKPYGRGHINDSYLITMQSGKSYILQRMNHAVFHDIPGLMHNILQVTQHLRAKLVAESADPDQGTLTVICTKDGQPYHHDQYGYYWRLFLAITPHYCYNRPLSTMHAYQGGKVLGQFQRLLRDFPPGRLIDTIPNFHHLGKHLQNFEQIVTDNQSQRVTEAKTDIAFIDQHADSMKRMQDLIEQGKLPQRVTHNDPKFNNVLLNRQGQALCLIDLDTVMPGYLYYDFADAVRAMCSTADEDEADINKVNIDLDLFTAFVHGFMDEMNPYLTTLEKETLVASCKIFPFALGVRFLSDYLNGDQYFKVSHPKHNLQRAQTQFQLCRAMIKQASTMDYVVKNSS